MLPIGVSQPVWHYALDGARTVIPGMNSARKPLSTGICDDPLSPFAP